MVEIADNKKGQDSGIVIVIFIFLLFCALFLPYVANSFNAETEEDKFSPVIDILAEGEEETCSYTFLDFILGHETCSEDDSALGNLLSFMQKAGRIIIYMFFWTFGVVPAWVDWIIFMPLRLIFLYLVVKLVRGV